MFVFGLPFEQRKHTGEEESGDIKSLLMMSVGVKLDDILCCCDLPRGHILIFNAIFFQLADTKSLFFKKK